MPELPEVETTVRGIAPLMEGRIIDRVVVRQPALRWPVPDEMAEVLTGAMCHSVTRRAKYICIETNDRPVLAHLGMSGSFRFESPSVAPKTHDHLELTVGDQVLRYHDPRRFGCFLWADSPLAERLLAGLGPEPLSSEFTTARLYRLSRRRTIPVKQFIMDNAVVVGVGNIYATEALFLAGIRPTRAANRIGRAGYARLVETIPSVLSEAIALGGSTLRDFVNSSGQPGYFQQTLHVYGRSGEPCGQCGRQIQSEVLGGRASAFCPVCQR